MKKLTGMQLLKRASDKIGGVGEVRKPKPQGRGIVKALGQKGTTGNFARIAREKGRGAAIGALQNKLAKRRGEPTPYKGKKRQ